MKTKERVEHICQVLDSLYPNPPIPLHHFDDYSLLIAVLLSAQCTDERVNKVTPKLFGLARTPFEMVKLSILEIEDVIRPCGLSPKKSKAIFELSKILIEKYEGHVPSSFEALESLPGVGHKTASVVMAQAFNVPAFPVDTHIHRLAQRWRLTNGKNVQETENDLKRVFDSTKWNKLHLQIIYFGREYCSARECFGLTCPICSVINEKRVNPIIANKA